MADEGPLSGAAATTPLDPARIRKPAIEAVRRIDALVQNWRRRITKKEPGKLALDDLGVGIDIAQYDVLVAISAPSDEFVDAGEETMVQTVAARLHIDPSRSSRIIAEMVEAGYVSRAVSQADARRAIVRLTQRGAAVVAAVRDYKHLMLADFLSEWSNEEIELFVPLFERFSAWTDNIEGRRTKYDSEIARLESSLRSTKRSLPPTEG